MELLVVASDEVGLPECVLAPWGFLAPPGDAAALAEQLRAALALGPAERRRAGAQAREWVRANADVDAETRRMAGVIEAIRYARRQATRGAASTRSRVLSAIVRQPASIAQRCSGVACGRIEAAADDEQVDSGRGAARPGSSPRRGRAS